jgi:hypothetical protein
MTTQLNLHADTKTTISRELPTGSAVGGWIDIKVDRSNTATLFPPRDVTEAADFWRYLSNVASDMAAYCEAIEQKEGK